MKKILTLIFVVAAFGAIQGAGADPKGLKQAEITAVVNDVSITNPTYGITKPAKIKDTVSGKTAVNTGAKSRAELLFNDKTLARIGANATFSFEEGTRNMELQKGTMLLQVPKGAGGATVRTAAVTAAITGTTIMIEHTPGQAAKVIVLEGTLRLYIKDHPGESILIKPGQMILMNPNDKRLPEPVDVDLKKLVSSSGLVNGVGSNTGAGEGGTLNTFVIDEQISLQDLLKQGGDLTDTPYVVDEPTDEGPPTEAVEILADTTKYSKAEDIYDASLATIDTSTVIQTDPTITKGSVTAQGGYYDEDYSGAPTPSVYLFGASSTFDQASEFGGGGNHIDDQDHAVFKFANNVDLQGQPTINTGNGASNVALVASTGTTGASHTITASGSATLNMNAGLALITEDGDINLANNSGSITMNGHEFFAYARGTNRSLTISCPIYAVGGDVGLNGELDVRLYNSITGASRVEVHAGEDFDQASGSIQTQSMDVYAGLINTAAGAAALRNIDITSPGGSLYVDSATDVSLAGNITGTGHFIVSAGRDFTQNGSITAQEVDINADRNIVVSAGGFTFNVTSGLDFITTNGYINLANTGGSITMNGSNFSAAAHGTSNDVTITCPLSAGGGNVSLFSERDILDYSTITGAYSFDAEAGQNFSNVGNHKIQASSIDIIAGKSGAGTAYFDQNSFDIATAGSISVQAPYIRFQNTVAVDFTAAGWAELNAGTSGILADYGITGFDEITSAGPISVTTGNLGAGTITVNNGANLSATGGAIVAENVNVTDTTAVGTLQVRNFNTDDSGNPTVTPTSSTTITTTSGGIQPHVLATPDTEHHIYAYSITSTSGGITGFGNNGVDGENGYKLEINISSPAAYSLSSLTSSDINFSGGNGNVGIQAGDGGTFKLFTAGDLTVNRNVYANPGQPAGYGSGEGGNIEFNSGGTLATTGSTSLYTGLNPNYLASGGGTIKLTSTKSTAGTGIYIQNSSQLRALTQVAPTTGALIQLIANQGSDIVVQGTASQTIYLEALQTSGGDLSKILMDTLNTSGSSGNINISTADSAYKIQMLADLIHIQSGANLSLQNATLNATNEIRLLAGILSAANGTLLFGSGVSLTSPNIYLSAHTIDFGGNIVNIPAGANVHYYKDPSTLAPMSSNFSNIPTFTPSATPITLTSP